MPAPPPEPFRRARASIQAAEPDPDVTVREIPAPARLAPYAYALSADVGDELASGRFIVLHDPDGQEAWDGDTRVVVYACADVEDDIGTDPLLPDVGWAWLLDALEARGAAHRAAGGTVTRTVEARYGTMAATPGGCEIALRCSWTPAGDDLAPHFAAFRDVLRSMAGLPPGVARLPLARPASC